MKGWFIKVKFSEMTTEQKLSALHEMIDFILKDRHYLSKKVDEQWYFEVVDPSRKDHEQHKHKAIAYNREHMKYLETLQASNDTKMA